MEPAQDRRDDGVSAVDLYRVVTRIRAVELALQEHIERNGFGGFWHPGLGQEGLQAGAVSAMRPDDYLFQAHRGLGYALTKGMSLEELLGDLFARTTGSTHGKGAGTVHFVSPELGVLGQGGTVGSCHPLAVGAALSSRLLGQDRVVVAFFGDGASARGTFHEAAITAGAWKLPIVWICENNGWAISARFSDQHPTEHVADRAAGYGMPGITVDGQDAIAVHEVVREAITRARRGEGPVLIEAMTMRVKGHYEGDRQKYRIGLEPDDDEPRLRDPLQILRERIDPAEADALDEAARAEVAAALEATLAAPLPGREAAFSGVWAGA